MRFIVVGLLAVLGLVSAPVTAAAAVGCDRGELCLWPATGFRGEVVRISLAETNPGECVPLEVAARSFVNLMSRDVIVYQTGECTTEGDFRTYPGEGTYVPVSPFVVRGIQLWPT
ncbi:hypothetical protein Acsp05_68340 [Actinokineospora sp. NBRC 105648]|nr:hypothetical protein Acsp05_68340 [Actinokineospora sp. NBRC 105648]